MLRLAPLAAAVLVLVVPSAEATVSLPDPPCPTVISECRSIIIPTLNGFESCLHHAPECANAIGTATVEEAHASAGQVLDFALGLVKISCAPEC